MSDLMQTPDAPTEGIKFQPVSARIRERIYRAKQRFHANDNIAAFLEPGELLLTCSLGLLVAVWLGSGLERRLDLGHLLFNGWFRLLQFPVGNGVSQHLDHAVIGNLADFLRRKPVDPRKTENCVPVL